MKEKDFQTLFHHFLESFPPRVPEVYELKICKTKRFSFSAVKDHQINGLNAAKTGLFHKISDSSIFDNKRGFRLPSQKPFDCLWIKADAYIVILFYVPRKPKLAIVISVAHFVKMRDESKMKSATFQDFVDYGCGVIKL